MAKRCKFPRDYYPQPASDNPAQYVIPARPGLRGTWLGGIGAPYDVPPEHHFIQLYLEDLAARKIDSLEAAREVLAGLTKASMLDKRGEYKGIYNALQAIRVFLTTEDYHKFAEHLKKLQKKMEEIRGHLQSEDISLARAEGARDQLAIIPGDKGGADG